jgi:putative endonuclease
MTNKNNTTLYTGVTSDLMKRVYEHKNKIHPDSFTAKYELTKLVYYEGFHRIEEAIGREKQIKGGSRKKKMDIINAFNPEWNDLFEDIADW